MQYRGFLAAGRLCGYFEGDIGVGLALAKFRRGTAILYSSRALS